MSPTLVEAKFIFPESEGGSAVENKTTGAEHDLVLKMDRGVEKMGRQQEEAVVERTDDVWAPTHVQQSGVKWSGKLIEPKSYIIK